MMQEFKRTTDGFNFLYEDELEANGTVILKMPPVSPNKRGINDIGWQSDGDISLFGTLSSEPESDDALWQEIKDGEEVNKTVYALKVVNNGAACKVAIRAILN